MAFFDEVGKKISQAGQTAVQKTKDITDIARINSLISDEEKKINNNYYSIGKLYATMHRNDYESDFGGMVTAISESEAKIQDYKQQINTIKGIVICEKCGAEVESGVAFCSSCGAAMLKQPQAPVNENLIKCTGCGAMVDKNSRFCTSCGKPTAAPTPIPTPTYVEAPVSEPVVAPAPKKCPNCGNEVADGFAFCTECGTKIN